MFEVILQFAERTEITLNQIKQGESHTVSSELTRQDRFCCVELEYTVCLHVCVCVYTR